MGAQCSARKRGWRLQRLEWMPAPHAKQRQHGCMGTIHPQPDARHPLQIRNQNPKRRYLHQKRPILLLYGTPPAHSLCRVPTRRRPVVRCRLATNPPDKRPIHRPNRHIRNTPRLMAAQPTRKQPTTHLSRTRARTRRIRPRNGLYPHRTPPHPGTPLRRILGISNHGLLRANQPFWHAR